MADRSVSTVMADVARKMFGATGRGIVWAVIDSGIDGSHPHFRRHRTLDLPFHRDFVVLKGEGEPLVDPSGHGTHVAGIIAGELDERDAPAWGEVRLKSDWGTATTERRQIGAIAGMAPETKLVSLKVLNERGDGNTSAVLRALEFVSEVNGPGPLLRIHGVNLSLGFDYDHEWFACGHSPLCVVVDRLVRSGVVVVVAAGNTGFGYQQTLGRGRAAQPLPLSINDPGNAELAITVGATHRDAPHQFGVSYFSSRGPTADGRDKPDLVAPGERIMSARSSQSTAGGEQPHPPGTYREMSGTAMAAAHMSGVAAAFLSVRREFIGDPLTVKEIFKRTAVDLKRHASFQGRGLVNLMGALQPAVEAGAATTLSPTPVAARRMSHPEAAAPPEDAGERTGSNAARAHARAVTLFCSYAHEDRKLREQFERSIVHLMRSGLIEQWHDGDIVPGMEWQTEIDRHLAAADLIVLLLSPDFMQSEFIHGVELKQAIQRHEAGTARVVPVVLRPLSTLGELKSLEALPRKAKAVTTWKNRDSAWADIAQGIERVVRTMLE